MAESKTKVFDTLYALNLNGEKEKKGKFDYLPWADAWAAAKKLYPDIEFEIMHFDGGLPYVYDPNTGYMVFTKITLDGITHPMWLPVMEYSNNAKLKATMTDINKTIMRCLVKNLAMFGLGLYLYKGEDLPETTNANKPQQTTSTGKKTTTNSNQAPMSAPASNIAAEINQDAATDEKEQMKIYSAKIKRACQIYDLDVGKVCKYIGLCKTSTADDVKFAWERLQAMCDDIEKLTTLKNL